MAGAKSWRESIDSSSFATPKCATPRAHLWVAMLGAALLGSGSAASFASGKVAAPARRAAVSMIAEPAACAGPSSRRLRILSPTVNMQAVMKDVHLACKYHKSVGYDGYLQVTIDGTAVAPVVRLDPESEQVVGYDDDAEETTCSTADVARAFDECVGERAPAVDRRITLAPVSEQYRLRNRRQLCR
jgi:hypothetical protein